MLYTFVNLQKIIDTLPCYEKTRLETEGAANVQVCLEDVIELLLPHEKEEFLDKYIQKSECHITLDDFDIDDIVAYLDSCGYIVREY